MDFELSDEQRQLQEALQRFVEGEYSFEQRKAFLKSPLGFNESIWRALAEQGVLGIGLPEAYGGLGGTVETMVVMEQLGRGLVLEPFMTTVVLCGSLITAHGTAAQQADILPRVIAGDCRIALAHHEAGARYTLDHVKTIARNGLVLSGTKTVVLDGAVANLFIVSARDETSGEVALFLVAADAPGVEVIRYRTQDGRNAADLKLRDVQVSKDAVLSGGLQAIEAASARAIAALCAEAVGIMEALNTTTLEYLKTREQFGQPIGRFQVLQHRAADMFVMAVQARSMSLLATARCDSANPAERRHALSAAKAFIGKAARFIGQQAVQLHGGMGLTDELSVSHAFKRLTMIDIVFGDTDHHTAAVAALSCCTAVQMK